MQRNPEVRSKDLKPKKHTPLLQVFEEMNFLKVRSFLKPRKKPTNLDNNEKDEKEQQAKSDNNTVPGVTDSTKADQIEDEEEDDDFITNEVKRRLKELRRNSFMVLIPEEDEEGEQEDHESYLGEDEGGGEDKCSSEWRDVVAEGLQWWGGFDAVYEKYCERMLFFDRLSSNQLKESGIGVASCPSTPSPRSASKKQLPSPFRCLSLKKMNLPEEDMEHLQQIDIDPCQDLETAYVAQLCLTWEALHCQYTQLSHLISSCQPETLTCYNHTAQQFQQFLVLLQRYIENEPFEQGSRSELYARARNAMPKLLQAPKIQGTEKKEMEKDTEFMVLAEDLIKILESTILTFNVFLKMDKKKPNVVTNLFVNNHSMNSTTPWQLVQSSIEKKRVKAKELCKKTKGLMRKNSWPKRWEGVQLLFAAIDIKLATRVLRMGKISKEQLLWCEEKMKKLNFSAGKLQRHPSPILFPSC